MATKSTQLHPLELGAFKVQKTDNVCLRKNKGYSELMSNSWGDEPDDGDGMGGLVLENAKPKMKRPSLHKVVLLNDDYTPMEFVVYVLEHFFSMDRQKSTQIMLKVHTEGKAVCGIYPLDIAETKARQVEQSAIDNEHPLKCEVEADT